MPSHDESQIFHTVMRLDSRLKSLSVSGMLLLSDGLLPSAQGASSLSLFACDLLPVGGDNPVEVTSIPSQVADIKANSPLCDRM